MKRYSAIIKNIGQKGFTLVELLIVVIILAVLAAIVVPQFGSSTEDASVATLKSNLAAMRNAVELYYQQHNARYPGKYKASDGTALTTAGDSGTADSTGDSFVKQLTQYTDKNGTVSASSSAVYKYGPYIKAVQMPINPFEDDATARVVRGNIAVTDITAAAADGATGWLFYVATGRLIANDGTTLSDGSTLTVSF